MLRARLPGRPKLVPLVAVVMLLLATDILSACPVCFGAAGDEALRRYYLSWAVLSSLPLLIVGSVLAWLWRYRRALRNGPNDPGDA